MRPHEILAALSPETAFSLFRHLQTEEKATFRSSLATLTAQRRLRPVFVERKPPADRYLWMQKECGRPGNEAIAANLLHIWLAGAQKPVILQFLDTLQLPHDGEGGIDALPPEPSTDRVREAVDQLLATHPHEGVAAYLHAFQVMEPQGWASLETLLAEDPRLQLGAASKEP